MCEQLKEQRDKLLRQTDRRETHREPSVADSLAFNKLTHEVCDHLPGFQYEYF